MADFVHMLVEMGFERDDAQKAVTATGNSSVQDAMEWILSNQATAGKSSAEESLPAEAASNGKNEGNSTAGEKPLEDQTVRSYMCNDCQKVLRNEAEMELHAAKTKHSNFSESTEEKKPLTEEEKKEQLRLIEEKIKIKRAEREAKEKQEALEREKMRVRSGKDLAEYKKKFEEQQMKEIADARRREKLEDKQARDRVKAQIEADRLARKAKEAGEQQSKVDAADGVGLSSPSATSTTSNLTSSPSDKMGDEPPAKKDYTQTKLQLRLPNGKALVQSFNVKEPLAAVRLFVQLNRDDGITTPFNLMTNFPKKTFEGNDYDMPLDALGLVPSAVLMISKTA